MQDRVQELESEHQESLSEHGQEPEREEERDPASNSDPDSDSPEAATATATATATTTTKTPSVETLSDAHPNYVKKANERAARRGTHPLAHEWAEEEAQEPLYQDDPTRAKYREETHPEASSSESEHTQQDKDEKEPSISL